MSTDRRSEIILMIPNLGPSDQCFTGTTDLLPSASPLFPGNLDPSRNLPLTPYSNTICASTYGVVDEPPQRLLSVDTHVFKFFNTLPSPSTLLLLILRRAEVEKWLKKWEIAPPEEGTFLERLVGVLLKQGGRTPSAPLSSSLIDAPLQAEDMAHHYELAHVRSLDPVTRRDSYDVGPIHPDYL
ncbi:hypothetical protein EDB83DRAFT_2318693 [Lactarius deliciosus]|nr:hypothetical protein EDB83DRAFT_2318693 [Lactarius deliciosus]